MLIQTLLQWEHVGFKGSIQQLWLLRNFWRDMNHHSQNKIEDIWDFFYGMRILPISIFALIYWICFSVCFLSDSTWIQWSVPASVAAVSKKFLSMHTTSSSGKPKTRQTDKQKVSKIIQTNLLLCNPKWNQHFLILPSSVAENEQCEIFWGWGFVRVFFFNEINIFIFAAIIWTEVLFSITNITQQ